ncbi:MAG TPA: substrate-binding domain-containing protein [Bryobacteraceae bacterium]|nr:substrate-binding domain-containing protein [Bryobacteraceae bacterium]
MSLVAHSFPVYCGVERWRRESVPFYHSLMLMRRRSLLTAVLPWLSGCNRSRRKVIGVVPKATAHLFFQSVHAGVDRAAKDFTVTVQWNGPYEETDHTRQIQIVDAMVTQRVDALAISATDERALAGAVQRAIQAGIPVTIFDSGVDVQDYVSFIATDNHAAGCIAARRLGGLIGGKGAVGMVMHKPGGTSTMLRERGFEETIAAEFPRVSIAARQYGMSDPAKSRAAAENMLTANPNLSGLFASSEPSSIGTIQAIKSRGLSGKLKLITFDSSDAHVDALRDGTIDLMLVQDPFRLGYEAVKSLVDKLHGATPVKRVDIPAREIAKADLEKPEVQALLFPEWLKKK